MNREFKRALEALARAAGMTVEYGCTYCREESYNPDGAHLNEIVTFIRPAPNDEED